MGNDLANEKGKSWAKHDRPYKAGYEYLLAYKITVAIYDYTVAFCQRYRRLLSSERTYDQMVQAARSGMQNIPEGYKQQSLAGYIKLAGVARGSIEELLKDYLAYARQHGIPVWEKERVRREIRESREIWEILKLPTLPACNALRSNAGRPTPPTFPALPENLEQAVNLLVDLTTQAGYLQDRLIASLKEKFTKEGGFRENLFKKRLDYKNRF